MLFLNFSNFLTNKAFVGLTVVVHNNEVAINEKLFPRRLPGIVWNVRLVEVSVWEKKNLLAN